jgi:hypothetical protein
MSAAELAAYLARTFSVDPLKDIWRHYDITRKDCPKYFIDHPEAFGRFKPDADIAKGETPEGA